MTVDTTVLTALITSVLGPTLIIIIKKYLDSRKKPDILVEALSISEKINAKLETIQERHHADRVWLTQFHNGGHFYPTGKSMAKFSMVYELVNENVPSIQSIFQNIPVNLFSKSINHLLNNNTIQIYDYADDSIATYGLKYTAESTGCKSSYLFAIKDINDRFIGTLGIDYTKRKTKLSDTDLTNLISDASMIGGALCATNKL